MFLMTILLCFFLSQRYSQVCLFGKIQRVSPRCLLWLFAVAGAMARFNSADHSFRLAAGDFVEDDSSEVETCGEEIKEIGASISAMAVPVVKVRSAIRTVRSSPRFPAKRSVVALNGPFGKWSTAASAKVSSSSGSNRTRTVFL